jgi:orotidine-5'-phosphate decarboxylase
MAKDVIIACDFGTAEETLAFLEKFGDRRPFVKIGMELFYAEGPAIVKCLKERGHKIFLDLKVHDIPNTVRRTMAVLSRLDVDIVNVHAAGSRKMMQAAYEGLNTASMTMGCDFPGASRPLIVAVTQLTSTDQVTLEEELMIEAPIKDVCMHYALNAKMANLDGVVCSAHEVEKIHAVCGDSFLTITPGIRLEGDERGDQQRVMTPAQARLAGSDYIVVGRPITKVDDPVGAYDRFVKEFLG